MGKKEKFFSFLQNKQALNEEQVNLISEKIQDENFNLESFILKEKFIDEEKLTEFKAEFHNLPYINLVDYEIKEDSLNFLPQEIANNYKIVCFEKKPKKIKVGLLEPNFKAFEAVNFLAIGDGLSVEYFIISHTSLNKTLKQYQRIEEEVSSALEIKAQEDDLEISKRPEDELDENISSAPISRIVSVVIRHAVEARASDIHIEPLDKESRVRYRVDGILHTSLTLPRSVHNAVIARIKVLAKLKLDETRVPQDGRIRLVVNKRDVDFRISTMPLSDSEKVVMRILDTVDGTPSLKDLGFNQLNLKVLEEGIKKTSGILLVTGPTGSGKTTTLYSLLNILNQENVNISTLEDPIEYEMKGVNQSQVRSKVGFTFANGLRSILRQDPDIIMVGEIRDQETAELAINAALTGHLVLSTLHTNDSIGAIFRLMDMNVESFLLGSTLRTIIAQRLSRKICTACRQERKFSQEEANEIIESLSTLDFSYIQKELPDLKNLEDIRNWRTYKAVGCSRCEDTGYAGRLAIGETINVVESLSDMISNKSSELSLAAVKKTQQFVSLHQDGSIKVLKGTTTLEEVLRVIEV
jgi:type IV pilus assembly protein PilB